MKIPDHAIAPLITARLTGELTHNSRDINEQAVRELVAQNPYWSLNSQIIRDANYSYESGLAVLIESLGTTADDFMSRTSSYIDPQRTAQRLLAGINSLRAAASQGKRILIATGHPGSMLELYRSLGREFTSRGAEIVTVGPREPAPNGRFLDQADGVIMLSDEGSLQHTHSAEGLDNLFAEQAPDWVLADHGFAAAAIDAKIKTVAIFDTDDPALPLAAVSCPYVISVPMNDNQTNLMTAQAVSEFLELVRES